MNVTFVTATPDAEKIVLYIARVSSDQSNEDTKLLNFLVRHGHWSPFEQANMTVEIITSRAIAAQILRHRSFTFQEFSQRYAEPDCYEEYVARKQADKNRQSSVDTLSPETKEWWKWVQKETWDFAYMRYRKALDYGIAKECARAILPLNTATKLYMTGTLRSWIHYIDQRTKEDVQLEHRAIAEKIQSIFAQQFPIISEALQYG